MTTSSPQEAAAENRQQHQQKGSQRQGALRGLLTPPVTLMALTLCIDITGFGQILPRLPYGAARVGTRATTTGTLGTRAARGQDPVAPGRGESSARARGSPVHGTAGRGAEGRESCEAAGVSARR